MDRAFETKVLLAPHGSIETIRTLVREERWSEAEQAAETVLITIRRIADEIQFEKENPGK